MSLDVYVQYIDVYRYIYILFDPRIFVLTSATVITIQIAAYNATEYGKNYKVAYMTTADDLTPKQACFAVAGTNDSKAAVQPILPDLVKDNYTVREVSLPVVMFTMLL